jgi:hypothetical protein
MEGQRSGFSIHLEIKHLRNELERSTQTHKLFQIY